MHIFKCQSLSHVQLFATPWTVAHEGLPSMGIPRQEHWNGLPFPSPRELSDIGIKPRSPEFQANSLPFEPQKPHTNLFLMTNEVCHVALQLKPHTNFLSKKTVFY